MVGVHTIFNVRDALAVALRLLTSKNDGPLGREASAAFWLDRYIDSVDRLLGRAKHWLTPPPLPEGARPAANAFLRILYATLGVAFPPAVLAAIIGVRVFKADAFSSLQKLYFQVGPSMTITMAIAFSLLLLLLGYAVHHHESRPTTYLRLFYAGARSFIVLWAMLAVGLLML